MIKIPRFNVEDWNQVHEWIKEWSETPVPKDLPDFAPKKIEIYPIILALLSNAEEAGKLSNRLFWLTVVLAVLTFFMAISIIKAIAEALLQPI
jgi:hypothetical protein